MHWFFSYLTSFIFKTFDFFLSKLIAFYLVRRKKIKFTGLSFQSGHYIISKFFDRFSLSKVSKIRKVGSSTPQLFEALCHGLFLQLTFGLYHMAWKQSLYIEVAQGDIFMEQKMWFGQYWKKKVWADYEQLLRTVLSCFRGPKKWKKNKSQINIM